MQIGTLNLYKGVLGTIELSDDMSSRYSGQCVIDGLTITYVADTVEELEKAFHKAVDEYGNSSTLTMAKETNREEMSRDEMIAFIRKNPNVKITHKMFAKMFAEFEYIVQKEDGNVYDENGYLFEDWYSERGHRCAGIRTRVGHCWETGWSVKKD